MTQSPIEKVIFEILDGKNEEFEKAFDKPYKNLVICSLQMVVELAEKEAKKQEEPEEEVIIDIFYSDMPKHEAMAIVNEIIENIEHVNYALKLVRMFMNNRIPVDRVRYLLNHNYLMQNK